MISISWPGTVVVKLGCIKLYQTSKCPKGLNETSVRLKFVFHRLKQSTHENKFVRQDYRIFFVAIHVCEWPLDESYKISHYKFKGRNISM